jgi:translation initiation factor IF-3
LARFHSFEMPSTENRTRVNDMIRIPEVRLVGADAQQIGVVPTHIAKQMAQEQGLDLVEVAPMARPPVCRIMDFGKYRFELTKKEKASKAKQHIVKVKEIKFHPRTDSNDYDYRLKHAIEFLEKGWKIKASVLFRGREMAHMDYGRRLLDQMVKDLEEIAVVEQSPSMEGRTLGLLLGPSRKKSAALAAARDKEHAAADAAEAAASARTPTAPELEPEPVAD